jgi:hypothetical protein
MCDKNHSFFIKSSSKYTLIYSNNVLVKLISCFTTDVVELSLSSTLDESLYNFDKYAIFVCFEGSVFGKRRSIHQVG